MNLIGSGDRYFILWHSSQVECIEEFLCSMFLRWNLNCNGNRKPFTVTSNSTTTFLGGQQNVVIMTDFWTSNQTRSAFQELDKSTVLFNIWVIPIWKPTMTSIDNTSMLLEKYDNIQLNSQIYVLGTDTEFRWQVFEIYRIPGKQDLITREVTKSSLGIWDRRIDLMGAPLWVAFLEEPPLCYSTSCLALRS